VCAYKAFNSRAAGALNRRAWLLTFLHQIVRANRTSTRSAPNAPITEELACDAKTTTVSIASRACASSRFQNGAGVDRALQSLPDDFRAAVVMVDVAELTYRETANVPAVPIETVRHCISHGRALMRRALAMGGPRGLASA
jgi:RNA polymerase sigma-70 factor, ECF subfamily